jgi:hypothetical protein
MADDASYASFLRRANNPLPSGPSTSTPTTVSTPTSTPKHPFIHLINDRVSSLSEKTFVTETDSDFYATSISSSALPSWTDSTDKFPDAADLEGQVEAGHSAREMTVEEWDARGEYSGVVEAVKAATSRDVVAVYKVGGKGGRFVVFILAKMDDGLVGVRALGVAT